MTTMKSLIQKTIVAIILSFSCLAIHAQDCVEFYFESYRDGGDIVVELKVDNFENILTSQFAFTYSYENLNLKDIIGNTEIDLTGAHIFSEIPGYISIAWSNPSTGQDLLNGNTLIEMRFEEFNSEASEFSFDPNFNTEVFDAFFEEVCVESKPLVINESRPLLVGYVYHDLNNNCAIDQNDIRLSGWTITIDAGLEQYFRITDVNGRYQFPADLGTYTVYVEIKNDLWQPCAAPILITVDGSEDILENSFLISPMTTSSALEITVSAADVNRCAKNIYSVRYKNNGTAVAQSAEIDFTFDENLSYVSNNNGNFSILNNVITFDIGNVRPGEEGDFQIVFEASCDNIQAGQTVCVDANISSSDVVIPPINWNGAVLTTKATCEGDSVEFTIENIGLSPMISPVHSIVVEDDVMFGTNEVDLGPQQAVRFKHAATGGVYRVKIDQEEGYPLGNFATDFIESCNNANGETFQYVSMFQNEDESPYVDIECQEVRDQPLANIISAFPIGYREDHLINQNEDIEYTINFQNTTSDTVFNLYIENLIDESLNVESIVPGPSSHGYTVSIKGDRILRFDFKNIQLMSKDANEARSYGYIKYRIKQNKDVAIGTKITNTSVLNFDLLDEIVSNQVSHIVGEEFIEISLNNENLNLSDAIMIAPNPATSSIRISIPESYEDLSFVMYDTKGRVISAANTPSNVFYIQREYIEKGMYFLEIRTKTKVLGTKKIIFLD